MNPAHEGEEPTSPEPIAEPPGELAPEPPVRTARRRGAGVAKALLALVVLGGALGAIAWQLDLWQVVRDQIAKMTPAPPSQRGAVMTSSFRIATAANGARPALKMRRAEESEEMRWGVSGLYGIRRGALVREILRESLLVAARDGLGASTRDGILGDPIPSGNAAGETPMELATRVGELRPFVGVVIRKSGDADAATEFEEEITLSKDANAYYETLLERAEELSRAEFPALLKRHGLEGQPAASRPAAVVPATAAKRLGQMTFPAQFEALREIHAAIRADGESPARLGALARGYANLGFLTEAHWTTAHKAFKARGLLYAQRMVATSGRSPTADALRHRAYAKALTGMHRSALDDLARAAKIAGGEKPAARADWVEMIEAFCRYDGERVKALGKANLGQSELADLLAFAATADPANPASKAEAGLALVAANPECFRVYDALCDGGDLGVQHKATVQALNELSLSIYRRLPQMAGLPPSVMDVLTTGAPEPKLTGALIEAGAGADAGEPSWSVLGQAVKEARFIQVARRVVFMRNMWSVPADGFITQVSGTIADHPYRPFIDLFRLMPTGKSPADLLRAIPNVDVDQAASLSFGYFYTYDKTDRSFFGMARRHMDPVAQDFAAVLKDDLTGKANQITTDHSREMLQISPHAPIAVAALISNDWTEAEKHASEWEKTHASHPSVLGALAKNYASGGRVEDARRCLEKFIKLSPDKWAYDLLAEGYKSQKNRDKWRETLEAYLKQPDLGLDHARVRVEIANDYMRRGEWDKAWPFAEAAAGTWAAWAMECAANCAEGRRDWEAAELWTRRMSERYPSVQSAWYRWCKRTGRGDLAAARAIAFGVDDAEDQADEDARQREAAFGLVAAGQPREALEIFRKLQTRGEAIDGLAVARLSDQLGDTKARDESLRGIVNGEKTRNLLTAKVCRLLLDGLVDPNLSRLDLKAIDRELDQMGDARGNATYFVGYFLKTHGKPEAARPYFSVSATADGKTFAPLQRLAAEALGEKPDADPQ